MLDAAAAASPPPHPSPPFISTPCATVRVFSSAASSSSAFNPPWPPYIFFSLFSGPLSAHNPSVVANLLCPILRTNFGVASVVDFFIAETVFAVVLNVVASALIVLRFLPEFASG